jgi:hypothetical protein
MRRKIYPPSAELADGPDDPKQFNISKRKTFEVFWFFMYVVYCRI